MTWTPQTIPLINSLYGNRNKKALGKLKDRKLSLSVVYVQKCTALNWPTERTQSVYSSFKDIYQVSCAFEIVGTYKKITL